MKLTPQSAAKQDFIPLMRSLVQTYQAFASYDAAGYINSDLTVPQADVIFTLGNTEGLSFKRIGESTLITKGTLTGVIDRLEAKALVKRVKSPEDARSTLVKLTRKGEKCFEQEFPRQISYLKQRFDKLNKKQKSQLLESLTLLKQLF